MSESTPPSASQPPLPPDEPAIDLPGASTPPRRIAVPLQGSERIILYERRHWIYLWPHLLLDVVLGVVPAVLLIALADKIGISGKVVDVIALVWLAFFVLRCLIVWYRYQNDVWAVTNQRVIDIRRNSPFDLRVATADLVNVQDMTVERHGVLNTILNYGNLICQTAGTQQEFRFTGVADPADVQALVDRERDRERMRSRGP